MKKVLRKSNFAAGILVLVVVCLGIVVAGDVIVKEGDLDVGGSTQLGDSTTTDTIGINLAPNADALIDAEFLNTVANSTHYFFKGKMTDSGDNLIDFKRTYGYYLDEDISGTDTADTLSCAYGSYIDLADTSTVNSSSYHELYGNYAYVTFGGTNIANLMLKAYGCYFWATGNMGTTGNTKHYGGNFSAGGTADENYGIYARATGSTTTNYGIYANAYGATTNYGIYSVNGKNCFVDSYTDVIDGTNTDLYIDQYGVIGPNPSSLKYKNNIRELKNEDTNRIYQLHPVLYDRKDGSAKDQIGLIAEEVAEVMPEIVVYGRKIFWVDERDKNKENPELYESGSYYDDETDTYIEREIHHIEATDSPESVCLTKLIIPMLKEIQVLRARVEELEAR